MVLDGGFGWRLCGLDAGDTLPSSVKGLGRSGSAGVPPA